MDGRAELVRPGVVRRDSAWRSHQIVAMALKGRNGAGGVQEGAMAVGAGWPSMFAFYLVNLVV
jgi:hypothetical protein